jgi:hypothetical protein
LAPGGSGGDLRFFTPGGETGMSIVGANRADLRFDGSTVKLLAGFGPGAMPSENGIAVATSGNVGIGTTSPTAKLTVAGDANQSRDKGGFAKAMIYVNPDGTIARCYNGITDSSTGNCGFSITEPINAGHSMYRIDFGFRVNDRFIVVTPHGSGSVNVGVDFYLDTFGATPNQVDVDTFITDVDYDVSHAEPGFMIIVY